MLLKKLYSEPEVFDPVCLDAGINIITGERSGETKSGNKTNGVGKTLLTHFIDFCLLGDYKKNRISKVPYDVLPHDTDINLDFRVSKSVEVTIRRNISQHSTPTVYVDGRPKVFDSLSDAREYLLSLCELADFGFSFREYLRLFKRVENKGYNAIDNPDGIVKKIAAFLHLFGIDAGAYNHIVAKAEELIEEHSYSKKLVEEIEKREIPIEEAEAYVNDLSSQIKEIDAAVETLGQEAIYETISDDIARLDEAIKRKNAQLVSVKEELRLVSNVPEYQDISTADLLAVYNDYRESLGDLIVRDLNEVTQFKEIIDSFKNHVLLERKKALEQQRVALEKEIREWSVEYRNKIAVLDKDGNLRSLKTTLHEQQLKRQDFDRVTYLYEQYKDSERKKHRLKVERDQALVGFEESKDAQADQIRQYQELVLDIHEYLYGNRRASFSVKVKEAKKYNQKTFASFEMSIDDSGSARTEHEKILIFDIALLFCSATRKRHLGLLLHDGAFEGVNEDTKFQLLNWLFKKQDSEKDFQYIVTINRDSFEALEEKNKFDFDLNQFVRANFTKEKRFLRVKYKEQ